MVETPAFMPVKKRRKPSGILAQALYQGTISEPALSEAPPALSRTGAVPSPQ